MRISRSFLAAVVAAALITLGFLHQRRRAELSELGQLRYLNAQMQYQAYQRDHAELTPTNPPSPPSPSASPASSSPAGYRNEGQATPQAALQTFAWACERGQLAELAAMIYLDPEQRRQAEAFLTKLPFERRARWHSVEEMAADLLLVGHLARPLPAADILAATPIEQIEDNRVIVRTPHPFPFRQVDGSWKRQVTADALQDLEAQLFAALSQNPSR